MQGVAERQIDKDTREEVVLEGEVEAHCEGLAEVLAKDDAEVTPEAEKLPEVEPVLD